MAYINGPDDLVGLMTTRREDAAARVRRRIREWVEREGHGSKKRLADAVLGLYGVTRSSSWVTDILDGPAAKGQDLRLRDLDAVAIAMGVPPGDLVRHNDNLYAEITPSELRILRFYRCMPETVRHHFIFYFEYLFGTQQQLLEDQARQRDTLTAEAKRLRAIEKRERERDSGV